MKMNTDREHSGQLKKQSRWGFRAKTGWTGLRCSYSRSRSSALGSGLRRSKTNASNRSRTNGPRPSEGLRSRVHRMRRCKPTWIR
jgi:hypothetical protein